MNEFELRRLLEQSADRHDLGAPPYASLMARPDRNRSVRRATLVFVAVVALVAGGAVGVRALVGHDRIGSPVARYDPPPPAPADVAVPDVVGMGLADATAALEAAGFHASYDPHSDVGSSNCLPDGQVLQQHPRSGVERPAGSTVEIDANHAADPSSCGLHLPQPSPSLQELASYFVTWARGDGPNPYLHGGGPVDLYVGGVYAGTIPADRIDDPHAWADRCAGYAGYAERGCPLSLLEPLRQYRGPIAATSADPGTCSTVHDTSPPQSLW